MALGLQLGEEDLAIASASDAVNPTGILEIISVDMPGESR